MCGMGCVTCTEGVGLAMKSTCKLLELEIQPESTTTKSAVQRAKMARKGGLDNSEVEKPEKTMSGIIHLAPLVWAV